MLAPLVTKACRGAFFGGGDFERILLRSVSLVDPTAFPKKTQILSLKFILYIPQIYQHADFFRILAVFRNFTGNKPESREGFVEILPQSVDPTVLATGQPASTGRRNKFIQLLEVLGHGPFSRSKNEILSQNEKNPGRVCTSAKEYF